MNVSNGLIEISTCLSATALMFFYPHFLTAGQTKYLSSSSVTTSEQRGASSIIFSEQPSVAEQQYPAWKSIRPQNIFPRFRQTEAHVSSSELFIYKALLLSVLLKDEDDLDDLPN